MIYIEGLDTEKGLANCNGSQETYLEVLESFLEDTHSKMVDLQFFDTAIARRWTAGEARRFTFAVHAIKGISAIIGAVSLSEQAAALEEESKAGSMRCVKKAFPEFFRNLRLITERIRAALKTSSAEGTSSCIT